MKPVFTLHVTSNRIAINGEVNPPRPDNTIKAWSEFRSKLPFAESINHNLDTLEEFRREGE